MNRLLEYYNKYLSSNVRKLVQQDGLLGPLLLIILTGTVFVTPLVKINADTLKLGLFFIFLGLLIYYFSKLSEFVCRGWNWLGVFIFGILLVTLFAPDRAMALIGFSQRYNSSFLLYLALGLLWIVVLNVKKPSLTLLKYCFISLGLATAIVSILQSLGVGFYGGVEASFSLNPARVPGLMGNPNFTSTFIASIFPLLFTDLISRKLFTRAWLGFYALSFLLLFWSLAALSSRGALLGLVASTLPVLFFLLKTNLIKKAILSILAVSALLLLFSPVYLYYRGVEAGSSLVAQDKSATDRFLVWNVSEQIILERPWLGVGPGNFVVYFWQHWPVQALSDMMYFDDPHNIVLYILSTFGLPLGLFILCLVLGAMAKAFRQAFKTSDITSVAFISGTLAIFVAMQFNPMPPGIYLLFVIFLGLGSLSDMPFAKPRLLTKNLSRAFVLFAVFWVLAGISIIAGEITLRYGYQEYKNSNFKLSKKLAYVSSRVNPFIAESKLLYAGSALKLQEYSEVEKWLSRSYGFSKNSPFLMATISSIYYQSFEASSDEKYKVLALQTSAQALENMQRHPVIYAEHAGMLVLEGRLDEARPYIFESIVMQPKNSKNWLLLAKFYFEKNRYEQYLSSLEEAWKLDPANQSLFGLLQYSKETTDFSSFSLNYALADPLKFLR